MRPRSSLLHLWKSQASAASMGRLVEFFLRHSMRATLDSHFHISATNLIPFKPSSALLRTGFINDKGKKAILENAHILCRSCNTHWKVFIKCWSTTLLVPGHARNDCIPPEQNTTRSSSPAYPSLDLAAEQ
jgi:hypothetical protein